MSESDQKLESMKLLAAIESHVKTHPDLEPKWTADIHRLRTELGIATTAPAGSSPAAAPVPAGRSPLTVTNAEAQRMSNVDRRAYMAAITGRVDGGFEAKPEHFGPFRPLTNEERRAHPFAKQYATTEQHSRSDLPPDLQNVKAKDVQNLSREQKEALIASIGLKAPPSDDGSTVVSFNPVLRVGAKTSDGGTIQPANKTLGEAQANGSAFYENLGPTGGK